MVNLSVTVNPSVQARFEKALNQAIIYNKRSVKEICDTTLLFVVRNAVNATPAATPGKIRNDLLTISKISRSAPIAAILVNRNRGAKGEPGLNGQKMSSEVESFIKSRQAKKNFIRSRWLAADKIMTSATKNKRGAMRIPSGLGARKKGQDGSGGAQPAKEGITASGYVFAVIDKIRKADTAGVIQKIGLDTAVKQETGSKLQYVLNHQIEEGIIRFNNS